MYKKGSKLEQSNWGAMNITPQSPTPVVGQKPKSFRKWLLVGGGVVVVAALAVGIFYFSTGNVKENEKPNKDKVLTVEDLNNGSAELTSETSNASVDNLTKELKAKIDKKIAAKENPVDDVLQLAGVLSNTTNATRQDQLSDFVLDFLANHEDSLSFNSEEYGVPDQLYVNEWKAQLYLDLVSNYAFMMQNQFTGADGKPIDTTADQLKYLDLYLAIATDPANWGEPQTADDGHVWYYHKYNDTEQFIEWRKLLVNKSVSRSENV
jgi:hypothetical protein